MNSPPPTFHLYTSSLLPRRRKMPAAACQRRAQPHLAALLRRSIFSLRRQPRCRRPFSTFSDTDVIPSHQINLFHTHVGHLFHSLLPTAASNDDPFSLPWLRRLLDGFLSCLHHFEPLLIAIAGSTSDDRFVSDVLHLSVKALDLCNFVYAASDSLTDLRRRVRIASSALSLGQLRRARRALIRAGTDARRGKQSWSAAMQLHAMVAGLAAQPSRDEADAGNAAEMAMHGMATVVVFFMWVLVIAMVPGGAGRQVQLPRPQPELQWAGAAVAVQERIEEEWRQIEKGGGGGGRVGMMVELRKMQWCAAAATTMPEPAAAAAVAVEVEEVCRVLEEELDPFQNRVREVFHGIVRCRTTVVDLCSSKIKSDHLKSVLDTYQRLATRSGDRTAEKIFS